jgi:putative addiction module component (TIGR02574 family)
MMSSLLNALGIDRLSAEDRVQLAEAIWDSLETEAKPLPLPLTETQRRELDRRLAILDAIPDAVTPWEVVEARLLARLKK